MEKENVRNEGTLRQETVCYSATEQPEVDRLQEIDFDRQIIDRRTKRCRERWGIFI